MQDWNEKNGDGLMLLNSQQSLVLNNLCDAILNCNKKICFVSIINENGRMIESKDCHGIIGCLSIDRKEVFYIEYALRQRMRGEFDDDFGAVRYTCVEREKEVLFSFPLHGLLVLVTCKIGIKHSSISKKIISLIGDHKAKLNLKTDVENEIEMQEVIVT